MIARRALLAAGLGLAAGAAMSGLTATPALAQIALYEGRLPDGFAYVRFVNTTATALDLAPDFTDPIKLGATGASRISPYHVVEAVAGKTLTVASGGGKASFQLKPGQFHTFLITQPGPLLAGTLTVDTTQYNQLRAKLSFYNAVPDCAQATLLLDPSGQSVFKSVAALSMQTRSINPVDEAKVHATCGATAVAPLDLGELSAGGLYTVWLMNEGGKTVTFLAMDSIAPYQK